MHRARVNQCDIKLTLRAESPISVLEGRYKKDGEYVVIDGGDKRDAEYRHHVPDKSLRATFPDNIPVSRTPSHEIFGIVSRVGKGDELAAELSGLSLYLPGASIRGLMRSYSEKILRTLSPDPNIPLCCDPFAQEQARPDRFCGKKLEDFTCSRHAYKSQCPICMIFGSTRVAGHIRIEDFLVAEKGTLILRDSVALDRFTGGVAQGPFRSLLLEGYSFSGWVRLLNFECWHLGLMAYVLRDFCEGRIPLGWGKSKGYGSISATVDAVAIRYYGKSGLDKWTELEGIEHRGYAEAVRFAGEKIQIESGLLRRVDSDVSFRHTYNVRADMATMGPASGFWRAAASAFDRVRDRLLPVNQYEQVEVGEG